MHGLGQFYWQKGGYYYLGEYKEDKKHGKGIMFWGLTKRYRGEWYEGYRHGYGELISIEKSYTSGKEEVNQDDDPLGGLGLSKIIADRMAEVGELPTDKAAVVIMGALFNKDKIAKRLW